MVKSKSIYVIVIISSILFASTWSWADKYSIPKNELKRVYEAGILAGKAMACKLDWKPYYIKFMQIERKKNWNDYQIAFIGACFGDAQGQAAEMMKKFSPEETGAVTKELKLKIEELNNIRFSKEHTCQTKLWWYDLGGNREKKSLIIYPVGKFDHAILFVLFDGKHVKNLEVHRIPDKIDHQDFSESKWAKAKGAERLTLVRDLIDKEILATRSEQDVIKLLGIPDGKYTREYGYKILK